MINTTKSSAIYQSISDGDEEREFKHWHASSIAACPRAHYMKRLGFPRKQTPTAPKILRWGAGHAIEGTVRAHIEAVYGPIESNVRLTSEALDLTGEYDNLALKDNRLVEIKSVHDYAVIERDGVEGLKEATGGRGPRGGVEYRVKQSPYLHHEWQNHAYVLLLKEHGIDVGGIDYVYITLSGRVVVYSTDVQQAILNDVTARLTLLNDAWQAQQPPACICLNESHPMYDGVLKWCDYKDDFNGCCVIPAGKETT